MKASPEDLSDANNLQNMLDMKKIKRGVLRHIPLIFIMGALFCFLGSNFSSRFIDKYKAQSVLIYQQPTRSNLEESFQMMHLTLPSAVEVVTLPSQLRAVISVLGLDMTVDELSGMIKAEVPVRESNLINITVTADSPELAADIANTLAGVVVKNTQEMNKRQWQAAFAYHKGKEQGTSNELDIQNRDIAEFRKEHRFIGMDATGIAAASSLRDAESQHMTANLEYKKMLVEYENLKREYSKFPDQIERQTLAESTYASRIIQLETALLDARLRYAPENPKIKALEKQLAELRKATLDLENEGSLTSKTYEVNPVKETLNISLISLQAKLRAALKLKEELEEIVITSEQRATDLTGEHITFAEMLRKKEHFESELKISKTTQRMLEVLLNLGKSDVEVYQLSGEAKESGNVLLATLVPLLGLLLGLYLGVVVAVVVEVFDNKLRTAKQVRSLLKLPCLATIPKLPNLDPKSIDQRSLFYVRSIYERVNSRCGAVSSLAVTSTTENEGKSYVAFHLAHYYKQLGKKTIIVEFDYRKSHCFDTEKDPKSLVAYLKGEATRDEIIHHGPIDRITTTYDPTLKELIKTNAMTSLWDHLKATYDLVIVDTPGVIEDEYSVNVISMCEAFLFVINSSKTPKHYVLECYEEFEALGVEPIGVVLNNVKPVYVDSLQAKAQNKRSKRLREKV